MSHPPSPTPLASDPTPEDAPSKNPAPSEPTSKGLKAGSIGIGPTVALGLAAAAPAYSLAVTLGFVVLAVGASTPAAFLLGFVPIWLGAGPDASAVLADACAWAVAMLVVMRLPLLAGRAWARGRGVAQATTLIVGAGAVGAELARRLAEQPAYGLRPVGFLDADPHPPLA